MNFSTTLLMATLLAPTVVAAAGTEPPASRCDGCHGPQGVSAHGDIPTIAGKSPALMVKALEQFRSLDRTCAKTAFLDPDTGGSPASMCDVAAGLDDSEIEALSQHYAGFEFVAAPQAFDADQAVIGASLHSLYCESCHPSGGSEPGYASRLAGQWRPYLERTIGEIRKFERVVPHMMERKLSDFSEEEIDAMLNFWASRQD